MFKTAFALVILAMTVPVSAATYVYVSLGGESAIAVYEQNAKDGSLTLVDRTALPGGPGSLALAPSHRFLYASVRSKAQAATLGIDKATGKLTLLGSTPVLADPAYLFVDPRDRFLLASYYSAGKVAVFPIREDGIVGENPTHVIDGHDKPHSVQVDRADAFAYVPNTGADKIYQFAFDSAEGKFAPLDPPLVMSPQQSGPRHFWFHPKLDKVYFVNESGGSITVCDRSRETGKLLVGATVPTLPAGFSGKNACAHIEITPSGHFLYASNRGHDSLAMFSIDKETGALTSLGHVPTEAAPRAFAIDPKGEFVHAAGQTSGKLVSYRIDSASGKLETLKTIEVGKSPAWITIVEFGK